MNVTVGMAKEVWADGMDHGHGDGLGKRQRTFSPRNGQSML